MVQVWRMFGSRRNGHDNEVLCAAASHDGTKIISEGQSGEMFL